MGTLVLGINIVCLILCAQLKLLVTLGTAIRQSVRISLKIQIPLWRGAVLAALMAACQHFWPTAPFCILNSVHDEAVLHFCQILLCLGLGFNIDKSFCQIYRIANLTHRARAQVEPQAWTPNDGDRDVGNHGFTSQETCQRSGGEEVRPIQFDTEWSG